MNWKQKSIKYCMNCQHNYKLYCTYYRDWQNKNIIKKCEWIKAKEENDKHGKE